MHKESTEKTGRFIIHAIDCITKKSNKRADVPTLSLIIYLIRVTVLMLKKCTFKKSNFSNYNIYNVYNKPNGNKISFWVKEQTKLASDDETHPVWNTQGGDTLPNSREQKQNGDHRNTIGRLLLQKWCDSKKDWWQFWSRAQNKK